MKKHEQFVYDLTHGFNRGVKLFLILAENHSILPEQQHLIEKEGNKLNSNWVGLVYPREGFSSKELNDIMAEIEGEVVSQPHYEHYEFIFISPIPYFLSKLSNLSGWLDKQYEDKGDTPIMETSFFHNDHKKLISNDGHKRWQPEKWGWELISSSAS